MSDFDIGLNGIRVAQQAIELIGRNLANAGSEGYHRQELLITPIEYSTSTNTVMMKGPYVQEVRRIVDTILESEITRQQPVMGHLTEELSVLRSVENTFGEINSLGLSTALNRFFGALSSLAAERTSQPKQLEVISAGDALAGQFRNLAEFLTDLDRHIQEKAHVVVDEVNDLTTLIANVNAEIMTLAQQGANTNMLYDMRDQAVDQLAQLVDVKVETLDDGFVKVVNISAWNMPLVLGKRSSELEVDLTTDGKLGVSLKDTYNYLTDLEGGKLGGLISLKNDTLGDIRDDLDLLARQVIDRINELHVQGVGAAGSFLELTGVTVGDETLDQWDADIQSGQFSIRLIDQNGAVTVYDVSVDPTTDTITSIRDKLNALDPVHLRASVAASALHVEGLVGWKFDFIPNIETDVSGLAGPDPPQVSVSGVYSGETDETFTCTVVGTGQVGQTPGLNIEVRDSGGDLLKTLQVGTGPDGSYFPGDQLNITDEIRVALAGGTLNDGEIFTIQLQANSDPTGFLAAAGMNTFFSGNSAGTIDIRSDIRSDPNRLAVSRGIAREDNANVFRMAEAGKTPFAALNGLTIPEFYRRTALDVGQGVAIRQARRDSLNNMLQQLENQRNTVSGVDMNEEAARLLVFERMFQAMSRFIGAQHDNMNTLMELI